MKHIILSSALAAALIAAQACAQEGEAGATAETAQPSDETLPEDEAVSAPVEDEDAETTSAQEDLSQEDKPEDAPNH